MEKISAMHSCKCDGREYAHLEKVCQSSSCFVCKDGDWKIDNRIFIL